MFVMTTLGQLTDQLPGAINQRELFNCLPEGSFRVLFRGLKVSKKVFFFSAEHPIYITLFKDVSCGNLNAKQNQAMKMKRLLGDHVGCTQIGDEKNLKSKLHWPSFFLPTDDI